MDNTSETCIFCKIVSGEVPSFKVWEDEKHLAFLDIFPNTPGVVLVIPKEHQPSDPLLMDKKVFTDLMEATRVVGRKVVTAFEDVSRVGIMIEGTGVAHAHIKIFPMHGTKEDWEKNKVEETRFFEIYPGFLSSNRSERMTEDQLGKLAEKIREASS